MRERLFFAMSPRFAYAIFILLPWSPCYSVSDEGASEFPKAGTFETREECEEACIGEHDFNCTPISAGYNSQQKFICRCATSGFYSRQELCETECEKEQYYSLFTYGYCHHYASTPLRGACRYQCLLRVRLWTTIFIIALFAAAAVTLLTVLPNLILNCVICVRMKKSKPELGFSGYHAADDASSINGDIRTRDFNRLSQLHTVAPAIRSWHYPYQAGYYGNKLRQ